MTRIDVHPPKMLCDQHLLSNHREIKRICNRLRKRIDSGKFNDFPVPFYEPKKDRFKELFWLDKGKWTYMRYIALYEECLNRNFNITDYSDNWNIYLKKLEMYNDFKPEKKQYDLLEIRILNRVNNMKIPIRYYGKEISFKSYLQKVWKPNKKLLSL